MVSIATVGEALGMTPAQLLPVLQQLRREGLVTGSASEGRYGMTAQERQRQVTSEMHQYTTSDGVSLISLRE